MASLPAEQTEHDHDKLIKQCTRKANGLRMGGGLYPCPRESVNWVVGNFSMTASDCGISRIDLAYV